MSAVNIQVAGEAGFRNPLGTEPVGRLIVRFAVPSIVSFLVSATYNIADQIFIGQGVGILGNAATNVAFPLVTICTALSLLLGIGSASNFNLEQGRGNPERAGRIAANGITLMVVCGIGLAALVILFLEPMVRAFGATEGVLPLATTYTGITCLSIPMLIFSTAISQLIRADGSPTYAMLCVLSGAIVNIILDPLFIFGFGWGMAGAAWATVISQTLSAVVALAYLRRFRSVALKREYFRVRVRYLKAILSLGAAASFNQVAMAVVHVAMNNTLTYYGALSVYGSDIPLAVVGVITKVNVILLAFTIGIAQGCQPVVGFNYGAGYYGRVKQAYRLGATAATLVCTLAFVVFQCFPREIVSIFGKGSDAYFLFAERYFRIFLMMTFINGLQQITSNFFTSIGKAYKGIFLSLTRQVIFLLPLILILPRFMGIDGVVFAGPVADGAAALLAVILVVREFGKMEALH